MSIPIEIFYYINKIRLSLTTAVNYGIIKKTVNGFSSVIPLLQEIFRLVRGKTGVTANYLRELPCGITVGAVGCARYSF